MKKLALILTAITTVLNVSVTSASGNNIPQELVTNKINDAVKSCVEKYGQEGSYPNKQKLKSCLKQVHTSCVEKTDRNEWCKHTIKKAFSSV
ncbi:MAG: hypothetical protein AB4062_01050 [Crocosphaera sp.]